MLTPLLIYDRIDREIEIAARWEKMEHSLCATYTSASSHQHFRRFCSFSFTLTYYIVVIIIIIIYMKSGVHNRANKRTSHNKLYIYIYQKIRQKTRQNEIKQKQKKKKNK